MEEIALKQIEIRLAAMSVDQLRRIESQVKQELKKRPIRPGDEPNAFSGPNPICGQGRDMCCANYKKGWDYYKGCTLYHREGR